MKKIECVLNDLHKTHGNKIELLEYNGSRSKSLFLCNICGKRWYADTYSVSNEGHGCPACGIVSRGKKFKIMKLNPLDKIIENINLSGCKFISLEEEYKGNTTKIKVKLLCNHTWVLSIAHFQRKDFSKRCPNCVSDARNLKITLSDKDVVKTIEGHGYKDVCFPKGYKNGKSLVSYRCENDHINVKTITSFKNNPTCKECKLIKMRSLCGNKSASWNGGITDIKIFLSKHLKDWKKQSAKYCKYKCVITGDNFDEIHHLYSMTNIIRETLAELGLPLLENVGDYLQSDLENIINKFVEIHYKYPLGVCLRKDIHILYHRIYGSKNAIPEDFYDFVSRINSGEIQIPE